MKRHPLEADPINLPSVRSFRVEAYYYHDQNACHEGKEGAVHERRHDGRLEQGDEPSLWCHHAVQQHDAT